MFVMSLSVHLHSWVVWGCTALLGLAYATIIPCTYTWVDQFMGVSGRFSSALWGGAYFGFMTIPVLIGYLFEQFTPMWLPHLTGICGVGMMATFIIISIAVWKYHQPQTVQYCHCVIWY